MRVLPQPQTMVTGALPSAGVLTIAAHCSHAWWPVCDGRQKVQRTASRVSWLAHVFSRIQYGQSHAPDQDVASAAIRSRVQCRPKARYCHAACHSHACKAICRYLTLPRSNAMDSTLVKAGHTCNWARHRCGCRQPRMVPAQRHGAARRLRLQCISQSDEVQWDKLPVVSAALLTMVHVVPSAVFKSSRLAAKFCVQQDPLATTSISNLKSGIHCFCVPCSLPKDGSGVRGCSVFVYARQQTRGEHQQDASEGTGGHFFLMCEVTRKHRSDMRTRAGFAAQLSPASSSGQKLVWMAPKVRSSRRGAKFTSAYSMASFIRLDVAARDCTALAPSIPGIQTRCLRTESHRAAPRPGAAA